MNETTIKRGYNTKELIAKKFKTVDFEGDWLQLTGKPELAGSWLIWGGSGEGKTSFCLMLADYLTQFDRVAYNSLEQGISLSLQMALERYDLQDSSVLFLDKESLPELTERLSRHKSPNVVIIDSLQYFDLTYAEYRRLRKKFRNKLFIFISHADGDAPRGAVANKIRYDADVKLQVKGFKAFAVTSRYLDGTAGEPYVIWEEGADKYWVE